MDTKMPGEESTKGVTELNNAGREDPNEVARRRENQIQATALAATGGEGSIAPRPAIDAAPAMREATINGQRVKVHVPSMRRPDGLAKFGPESRLPKGTLVKKDGTPCEGDEQPYGVIGDIELPDVGRLVCRVIPFEIVDEQDQAAAGNPAASKSKSKKAA